MTFDLSFPAPALLMNAGAVSVLSLGFFLGIKHALDADHLVAVSTMVSEKKGFRGSSIVGILWGMGHTASLLVAGLLVLALDFRIPDTLALSLEFLVALMIIGLGVNVLWKVFRGDTIHVHKHTHGSHTHIHIHSHSAQEAKHHEHVQAHSHSVFSKSWWRAAFTHGLSNKRTVLIGLVHGMAGSAALMLVVLTTIQSTLLGLVYIGVFGVGSIAGMLVMSTLLSVPFVITANASERIHKLVRGCSGIVSVAFGLFLAWQIGVTEGLLF